MFRQILSVYFIVRIATLADRRIPEDTTLKGELAAWQDARNADTSE
jgi:hypothetical protein